jgi:hypothetical protein
MFVAGAVASAVDHPYGAPAALPAPAHTRVSPYWSQQAAYQPAEASPSDVKPESLAPGNAPLLDGYNDYGYGGSGCCGNDYDGALGCGCYDAPCCCPTWYGSVAGLIMNRTRSQCVYTTYDNTNPNDQLLCTEDAELGWQGGFQVTGGRRFGCDMNNAIEVTYWTLGRLSGAASITGTGTNLSTPIDVGFVEFDGDPASDYFDNALTHRVYRNNQFHNVEINLLRTPLCCGERLQVAFMGGVRWFYFDENLLFSSYQETGESGHLGVNVTNNLIGCQVGARASWCVTPRFRLFATPKVGLYANIMDNDVSLYTGTGVNGTAIPPAPGLETDFPLNSHRNNVAILSEIDVGFDYQINCNLRVFAGYRVVAISGVALSDQQIPPFLVDVPEWNNVDNVGNLFLHGGFAGAEFRF